jgi:DNA-binding NtrC family response regulator
VALVAPSDSRILITGESGVGKEVVTDLIHAWSPRASGPLIKVNCAALPETLLESELFGHEKGAFTGAVDRRVGRFEEATDGTILLDEVSEMSPGLQSKLLRITQDGTFQRVGSNEERKTNARILASTNRNLETEVQDGRFREDLFFRLNVIEIYVPPLRERPADVVPLANLFARQFSGGRPRFSPAVISCLEVYDWPGNVRELRNAMERANLMSRGEMILPEHLPKRVQKAGLDSDSTAGGVSSGNRMEEVERALILRTLRENDNNRTETARLLGISRRALIYKLRRYREQGYDVESA